MKFLYFAFLFLLQFSSGQSYYPLQAGNQWYYDSTSAPVKVLGDSLFPNGKIYSVLSKEDIVGGKYVRADSHYVYYFRNGQERRVFKLNGNVNDTTLFSFFGPFTSAKITNISTIFLFGDSTRVVKFRFDGVLVSDFFLSDKFGLITEYAYGDPPSIFPNYVINIVGGIVNGKKYGFTMSVNDRADVPDKFSLSQNYPNPFNPATTIEFSLVESEEVRLTIFDYLGREVETLVSGVRSAGRHTIRWNAGKISSGIYFYRLTAGEKSEMRRLVLLK